MRFAHGWGPVVSRQDLPVGERPADVREGFVARRGTTSARLAARLVSRRVDGGRDWRMPRRTEIEHGERRATGGSNPPGCDFGASGRLLVAVPRVEPDGAVLVSTTATSPVGSSAAANRRLRVGKLERCGELHAA